MSDDDEPRRDLQVTTITTGRWRENCYIVTDRRAGRAVVIDPGDDADAILRALARLEVDLILLTHGHYDHVGAASAVSAAKSAQCCIHSDDRELLGQAAHYAFAFEGRTVMPPTHALTFSDGASFDLGGRSIRVLWTPGHTMGSVSFRLDDLLWTGDTLLRKRPGRTDLPGGDPARLRTSITSLLARDLGVTTILPGHGPAWSMDDARDWWRSDFGAVT